MAEAEIVDAIPGDTGGDEDDGDDDGGFEREELGGDDDDEEDSRPSTAKRPVDDDVEFRVARLRPRLGLIAATLDAEPTPESRREERQALVRIKTEMYHAARQNGPDCRLICF